MDELPADGLPANLRFRPTDEILIDYYLRRKHLGIDEFYVNRFITTVNISNFDPWNLPFESEQDWDKGRHVWYFYSSEEYKTNQIWKTSSGYWKETGVTIPITGKGEQTNGIQIGEKKVMVFQCNENVSKSNSHWVMEEYHATFLPQDQRKYVICKVEFKEGGENNNNASSSISGSEILTPDYITDVENILKRVFDKLSKDDWESMFDDKFLKDFEQRK